jgi:hypothetical protein
MGGANDAPESESSKLSLLRPRKPLMVESEDIARRKARS